MVKNCIGHYIIPFLEEENNGNGNFIYIALFTTTNVLYNRITKNSSNTKKNKTEIQFNMQQNHHSMQQKT